MVTFHLLNGYVSFAQWLRFTFSIAMVTFHLLNCNGYVSLSFLNNNPFLLLNNNLQTRRLKGDSLTNATQQTLQTLPDQIRTAAQHDTSTPNKFPAQVQLDSSN